MLLFMLLDMRENFISLNKRMIIIKKIHVDIIDAMAGPSQLPNSLVLVYFQKFIIYKFQKDPHIPRDLKGKWSRLV